MKFIHWIMLLCALIPAAWFAAPVSAESRACSGANGSTTSDGTTTKTIKGTFEAGESLIIRVRAVSGPGHHAEVRIKLNGDTKVGPQALPATFQYTFPFEGRYEFEVEISENPTNVTYKIEWSCGNPALSALVGGGECPVQDGRINGADCAAPVALYDGDIYGINPQTGEGILALRIAADIVKEPRDAAAGNVLIASGVVAATGQPINVYWLTSNELQVVTAYADGKPYVVAWPVNHPEQIHHAE